MTLAEAEALLAERGVDEARANAEFILAAVLKAGRNEIRLHPELSPAQARRFEKLIQERAERIPLAYVLGSQDFMGLEIAVAPDVLIPRPETEELVVEAERRLQGVLDPIVLDLGTGSGCIAIALARKFPKARIIAADNSAAALRLARRNARSCGVARSIEFIKADIFRLPKKLEKADMIVSNPPYIPSALINSLQAEVLREPRQALDGGPDGLAAIRAIAAQAPRLLKAGGWLLLEIGAEQGPAVSGLLQAEILRDAQGLDRIAVARF